MTEKVAYLKQLVETKATSLGLNPFQIETLLSLPQPQLEYFLSPAVNTARQTLDKLIIPHNLTKMNAQIEALIQSGKFTVMSVAGEEGFSYSVGLTVNGKHSHELLVGASIGTAGHSIINEIADMYPDHQYPITPIELDTATVNKRKLRCRIIKSLRPNAIIEKYFARIDQWTRTFPKEIYLVVIGDKNNVLPGEPGYDENLKQLTE